MIALFQSCQLASRFVSRVGGVSVQDSLSTLRMLNIVRILDHVASSVRSTIVEDCSFSKKVEIDAIIF